MEVMCHASSFLLPHPQPQPQEPREDAPPPAALTYAVIVLNQRLPRFAPLLWNRAQLRVCADGGANRVYDDMPELFPDQDPQEVRLRYTPDVIKGDLDSIRDDVKDFYLNLGVRVVDESHDQDTTDLHKCVAYVSNSALVEDKSKLCILVVGALGGRFDHEIGNINVLHRFSNLRIVLLSDDCLIHLLPKTHSHVIHVQLPVEGPHCGLIPIGAPSACTSTTGLQWNLSDTAMSFGGLISTSNVVKEDKVTVSSDADLIWTISIKKPIKE
ncbi:thiamine pyrophosphokinase 1 [Rhynchospora pubera]|uniref:Thiamine pyrophosphokinase n=1 Tax=Rhynchospora pubera TaxID=906938 RepID=A0AAV8EV31_9POAL|nr:thiamine pyrophosphokinase 1 [Rhynchospora pubera]